VDPAIHPDVFAGYEAGILEIKYRVDDVRDFTHPGQGMKLRQGCMVILGVHGVLTTPGETVLNRMLFAANSSAKALLTAGIGDFDSTAKRAPLLG
jgi:hypothetical protein